MMQKLHDPTYTGTYRAAVIGHTGRGNYGHGMDIVFAGPRQAMKLIKEGKIGRLRALKAYGKQDRRGGGQDLMVLGTHMLDLMRFFAGDARWCHARVATAGHPAGPADVAQSRTELLGPLLGDD